MTRTGEPAPRLLAEICVPTATRMRWLGRRLAALLCPGDLIVLNGQLGAGKTTLVQGIGDGLDVRGPVTSPTFVIARIHPALRGGPALVHVDAYRLSSPAEVDDLDLDADLDSSVTVVEWGGGLAEGLAPSWLEVTISLPRHGTASRVSDGEPGNAGSEPGDGDGGPGEATGGTSGAEAGLAARVSRARVPGWLPATAGMQVRGWRPGVSPILATSRGRCGWPAGARDGPQRLNPSISPYWAQRRFYSSDLSDPRTVRTTKLRASPVSLPWSRTVRGPSRRRAVAQQGPPPRRPARMPASRWPEQPAARRRAADYGGLIQA